MFARYNVRNRIFKNKKKLKDTGVSITESLTPRPKEILTKTRNEYSKMFEYRMEKVKSDDSIIIVYYD